MRPASVRHKVWQATALAILAIALSSPAAIGASSDNINAITQRLIAAYPDKVKSVEGNDVIFSDQTRLPFDDGKTKDFKTWLSEPDIEDMFRVRYPWGAPIAAPEFEFDPGRARNEPFFEKIYGDCKKPGFEKNLATIVWLPKKSGAKLKVAGGAVAERLTAVSRELDQLPAKFDKFLVPAAGGFYCRNIAGTDQRSGHGYGIAIDISTKHSHYWKWAEDAKKKKGAATDEMIAFVNEIPPEIIAVFEKHGFIWGGRWYHYDTMHFEFRPELLETPLTPLPAPADAAPSDTKKP